MESSQRWCCPYCGACYGRWQPLRGACLVCGYAWPQRNDQFLSKRDLPFPQVQCPICYGFLTQPRYFFDWKSLTERLGGRLCSNCGYEWGPAREWHVEKLRHSGRDALIWGGTCLATSAWSILALIPTALFGPLPYALTFLLITVGLWVSSYLLFRYASRARLRGQRQANALIADLHARAARGEGFVRPNVQQRAELWRLYTIRAQNSRDLAERARQADLLWRL